MDCPFDPADDAAFLKWRDAKLGCAPASIGELLVEVNDPRQLSASERSKLACCVRRANMAVYASKLLDADSRIPLLLGQQFGLTRLDANWLAGEDGISEIKVSDAGTRKAYIPYTDRPIKWHTDGYYNPPERTIRAMVLHCVNSAASGGENRLLDPEMLYLLLRQEHPDYAEALFAADAMTIPERLDESDVARAAQPGPVFSIDSQCELNLRYTARTRSIHWKQDPLTLASVAFLEKLLAADSPHIHRIRLEPGMGLLCNNVLHDRASFVDSPDHPRLLYRARFYDRIRA